MRITILGAAAGGGFPQWNCNCANCSGVRAGTLRARPRTQSSIFIRPDHSADGVLFNASPDILEQIRASATMQPGRSLRDTAIAGGVQRQRITLDGRPFEVPGVPGLQFRALPLQSKAAPYSPHREQPVPGDNIGISVIDSGSGRSLFYAPGLGAIEPAVFDAMAQADCVMVDGTFWTDDEMVALGISSKTARSIGHLPQSGPGGMIEWLAKLPEQTRRLLIHINNTNPILDEDSAERAELARARIGVCEDRMEILL